MAFPKPYVNDVKVDNSIMVYENEGDFSKTGIGSRSSGMPSDAKSRKMGLDHVGENATKTK